MEHNSFTEKKFPVKKRNPLIMYRAVHCHDGKRRQLREFNLIYTSDWSMPRSLSSADPSTKILCAFLTSPNSLSLD